MTVHKPAMISLFDHYFSQSPITTSTALDAREEPCLLTFLDVLTSYMLRIRRESESRF